MGLLIAGLVTGIRLWMAKVPLPGLEVSLFWGLVNLILIGVAILAAAELPEWRKTFRIRHRLPCELVTAAERFSGTVEDMNETGALIYVNRPLLEGNDHLRFSVISPTGDRLTIESRLCRQERVSPDAVAIGLKFIDVGDKTSDSLIAAAFSDSRAWNQPEVEPGIFRSLWSIFRVFRMVFAKSRTSHRRYVRVPYRQDRRLVFQGRTLDGTLDKISTTGLSVNIPGTVDLVGETGTLYVESCALKVRRSWAMQCEGTMVAGFTIEQVDKGADQWRELTSLAALRCVWPAVARCRSSRGRLYGLSNRRSGPVLHVWGCSDANHIGRVKPPTVHSSHGSRARLHIYNGVYGGVELYFPF